MGSPSPYPSGSRVYVDECKARGYFIVASVAMPNEVSVIDKELRSLRRPGQRRIHFAHESDSSRRRILSCVERVGVKAVVYKVSRADDKRSRQACLEALITDAAGGPVEQLVLERDASLEAADRRVIAAALRRSGRVDLKYRHADPHECPMLWVSDMVAWCSSKGGDWLRRARPMISAHHDLAP
ncbi:MAG: hypothetical protein K0S37_3974 [Microbacterium sp.]|nr:hypothetical protein [Microbacterium sp.]